MPIDPNIVLQAGNVKPLDYGELTGRALTQIGQQQQIAYQRDQMAANERAARAAEAKQATLGQVGQLAASGDAAGARKAALGAGQFDIIEALDKMDGAQVERMKAMAASTAPIIAQLGKIPAGPARVSAFQQAAPLFAQGGYTPQQLEQLAGQINNDDFLNLAVANGMKISEYNTQQNADRSYGLDREKFGYQQANDAAGRQIQLGQLALTRRGQDMADARARETNRGMGNAPSGYRFLPDGSLQAIPGGPAGSGKPLTEDQGKSTGYYRVMRQAADTLNGIKGYNPTVIANALDKGDLTGTQLSQVDRRALNAQRAFVVAALRAESGATYGPSEVIDKVRTLFPVPGDGPEVLADKARLRAEFLASARDRGGSGVANIPRLTAPKPQASAVAGGTVAPGKDGIYVWKPGK